MKRPGHADPFLFARSLLQKISEIKDALHACVSDAA